VYVFDRVFEAIAELDPTQLGELKSILQRVVMLTRDS